MTNEEISKVAYEPVVNKTKVTFKNKTEMLGYFEGNVPKSKLYFQNKWLFVIMNGNSKHEPKEFNGDEFHSILL